MQLNLECRADSKSSHIPHYKKCLLIELKDGTSNYQFFASAHYGVSKVII